jgi:hypothetical protein
MKTEFNSFEHCVSNEELENHFDGYIEGVDTLELVNIELYVSGHGHYKVKTTLNVNDKEIVINAVTSNMNLTDAWKSGERDLYYDGDDGFDNWNEVVTSMLRTCDILEIEV